jgi:hypothetical protein
MTGSSLSLFLPQWILTLDMNRVQVPVKSLLNDIVSRFGLVTDIHRGAEKWKYIGRAM